MSNSLYTCNCDVIHEDIVNDVKGKMQPKDFMRNIGEDVEMKLFSPVTWEEKGKKYSAKEFVGVLKEYREDTETIVLSMDDIEMETPVKEIALIRKYITF